MGCGTSKTSASQEMEKRNKARDHMEKSPGKENEGGKENGKQQTERDSVTSPTTPTNNPADPPIKPRRASVTVHEEKMIMHDWRKGTEDELHKRIQAVADDEPSTSTSRPARRKKASSSHAPAAEAVVSKARTKASKAHVAKANHSHAREAHAREVQREGSGGDDADDETSDDEALPQQTPRVAPPKQQRKEPSLPGAVSDDDIPVQKSTRASNFDGTPLLSMFRPKSALNFDLD
eukprot:m.323770 g.323770  ORF g.323770 m.323770 type:complete len:235 (-) comp27627_c0_seq4:3007-3711(-)